MPYHLICVHQFDGYAKGQMVTEPAEVEKHLADREHHFVRIAAPEEAEAPARRKANPSAASA